MWGYGMDRAGSGQGQVAGTCECGNEPSGSVKCGEFLDQLRTGQLLKQDPAACSQSVSRLQNTNAVQNHGDPKRQEHYTIEGILIQNFRLSLRSKIKCLMLGRCLTVCPFVTHFGRLSRLFNWHEFGAAVFRENLQTRRQIPCISDL